MSGATAQDVVTAALAYARSGWRVIPLHWIIPGTVECSCSLRHPEGKSCPPRNRGKHPINGGWQNTPPLSGADIMEIWQQTPQANLGVATGAPSGFFVLDIDPENDGDATMRELVAQHGPMPATLVQQTGSGGYHYLFSLPDFEVRNKSTSAKWLGGRPGVDLRGNGGQIVVAPSVSGKGAYSWVTASPIAPAPDWLLQAVWDAQDGRAAAMSTPQAQPQAQAAPVDPADAGRLSAYAAKAINAELGRLVECQTKGWGGPAWNQTTYAVACNLTEFANTSWSGLTHEKAEELLLEHAPRDENFGDYEIRKCLMSARNSVGQNQRPAPLRAVDIMAPFAGVSLAPPPSAPGETPVAQKHTWDDLGNAGRIVQHFGSVIRWIPRNRTWAVYDGARWDLDDTEGVTSRIQWMMANLDALEGDAYSDDPVVAEADGDEDDKSDKPRSDRQRFKAWAAKQRTAAKVEAAQRMARARPELQASPSDFDRHPMLLNVRNGVLDLTTGALRPHDPSLLLSQMAGVAYDPTATAPQWDAVLAHVQPDPHMRAYLQRVSGYSATGDTGEQVFFVHQGPGANFKSQYLVVMQAILGDYNQIMPRSTLLAKSGEGIPTDIARMVGKRFLQASETNKGRVLDEEVIKNLNGDEGVVARHLYGKEFEYAPTGKIHYVTNHLPRVSDADSIWRRLHLIRWRVVIPEEQKIRGLGRMLARDEGPGILNWIVQGALAWQQLGSLGQPDSARADVAAYRSDADELGEFIDDHIVRTAGGRAPIATIYSAYSRWVTEAGLGHRALSRQVLSMALKEKGFEPYRDSTGRGFLGISVKSLTPVPFDQIQLN